MPISDTELKRSLVDSINARVDIAGDWIDEKTEESMIAPVVEMIVPMVPQMLRPIIVDAEDGLDDEEIAKHRESLMNKIKDKVDFDSSSCTWYSVLLMKQYTMKAAAVAVDVLLEYAQKGAAIGLPS